MAQPSGMDARMGREASEPQRSRKKGRKPPAEGAEQSGGDGRLEAGGGARKYLEVEGRTERRAERSDSSGKRDSRSGERREPSSEAPGLAFSQEPLLGCIDVDDQNPVLKRYRSSAHC